MIERAPQTVDVRPVVNVMEIDGLLGGHVVEGAHGEAVFGRQRPCRRSGRPQVQPSESQVQNLESAWGLVASEYASVLSSLAPGPLPLATMRLDGLMSRWTSPRS